MNWAKWALARMLTPIVERLYDTVGHRLPERLRMYVVERIYLALIMYPEPVDPQATWAPIERDPWWWNDTRATVQGIVLHDIRHPTTAYTIAGNRRMLRHISNHAAHAVAYLPD